MKVSDFDQKEEQIQFFELKLLKMWFFLIVASRGWVGTAAIWGLYPSDLAKIYETKDDQQVISIPLLCWSCFWAHGTRPFFMERSDRSVMGRKDIISVHRSFRYWAGYILRSRGRCGDLFPRQLSGCRLCSCSHTFVWIAGRSATWRSAWGVQATAE